MKQLIFSCDDYFHIVNVHHSCWMNFRLKTLQSPSCSRAPSTAHAARCQEGCQCKVNKNKKNNLKFKVNRIDDLEFKVNQLQ